MAKGKQLRQPGLGRTVNSTRRGSFVTQSTPDIARDNTEVRDYLTEVTAGNMPGVRKESIFGVAPALTAASGFETVWDAAGNHVYLTASEILDLVSDNVNDVGSILESGVLGAASSQSIASDPSATFITNGVVAGDFYYNTVRATVSFVASVDSETQLTLIFPTADLNLSLAGPNNPGDTYEIITNAGTGASAVHLWGLDGNGFELNEVVVLNGTTPVSTVQSFFRVNRCRIIHGSTRVGALGEITLVGNSTATLVCDILAGNNQGLSAIFTTPSTVSKVILAKFNFSLDTTMTTAAVETRLRIGSAPALLYTFWPTSLRSSGTSFYEDSLSGGFVTSPFTDFHAEADTSTNNVGVSCSMEFLLFS